MTLGKDTSEEEFNQIKRTINYIVRKYGCHSAKYCVVLHQIISNINFEERFINEAALRAQINRLRLSSSGSSLDNDLSSIKSAFEDQTLGENTKKVRYACAQPFLQKVKIKSIDERVAKAQQNKTADKL